ncbi:MAG: hypothetical protein ABIJ84_02285 [bacterium]
MDTKITIELHEFSDEDKSFVVQEVLGCFVRLTEKTLGRFAYCHYLDGREHVVQVRASSKGNASVSPGE